jgi:hypothetical protein
VHVVTLQAFADAHTTWPGQGADVTAPQVPAPSQLAWGVKVESTHLGAAQGVPPAVSWHFPAPSQAPVDPQALVTGQAPFDDPPAATGWHVPLAPPVSAPAQDMQVPSQALSQHSPAAQNPLEHAVSSSHAAPFASLGLHWPAAQ